MPAAIRTMFVDWGAEPDERELASAAEALMVDPAGALPRLISLAERGSPTSMVHLGDAYRYGLGTNINLVEAEKWYRKAANRDSVFGHYDLAALYLASDRILEAKKEAEFAAAKGYPPALNMLGRMYLSGIGAERDFEKARTYLERACSSGHIPGEAALARLLMKRHWNLLTRLIGVLMMIHAQITLWGVLFSEGLSSERLR